MLDSPEESPPPSPWFHPRPVTEQPRLKHVRFQEPEKEPLPFALDDSSGWYRSHTALTGESSKDVGANPSFKAPPQNRPYVGGNKLIDEWQWVPEGQKRSTACIWLLVHVELRPLL
jgi:hypothetical protein